MGEQGKVVEKAQYVNVQKKEKNYMRGSISEEFSSQPIDFLHKKDSDSSRVCYSCTSEALGEEQL